MKTTLNSDIAASEALINCWIREGGMVERIRSGWIRIPIEARDARIDVFYDDETLLQDVRLSRPPFLGTHALAPLELAEVLVEEMTHLKNSLEPTSQSKLPSDWKPNVEHSIEVLTRLFKARLNAPDPLESTLDFISSEQSLVHGHRFHPSPKSRIGFSNEDLEKYSPEWKGRFRLHYFGVADDAIICRGDPGFAKTWIAHTAPLFGSQKWVLPVHPWQARKSLEMPEVQKAIRDGVLTDLGEAGPEFYATSSVRTLYQPSWDLFVKTSLHVRITNCFRLNLPNELEALHHIRQTLRKLFPGTDTFRLLDEPLSLDLVPSIPVRWGVIFREGIERFKSEGVEPLLAAALFGDSQLGAQRLSKLIPSHVSVDLWFKHYCESLVPPVLRAFCEHGVMFEPHLQNILLCVGSNGSFRFLQRDLDNVKVVEGSHAAELLSAAPDLVKKECFYAEDIAWRRLVYCLIVNHLSEVIATLARLHHRSGESARHVERDLWLILREVIRHSGDHPRITSLINEPFLWAKKNFFTRATRTPDKEAPFALIQNPLAHQNSDRVIA